MREAILSLDVGSTAVKGVLFGLAGHELAVAERAVRLHTPQPGWAELDPEEIWQAVVNVVRTIRTRQGAGEEILAVALTSQGGSLIPAREDGTPVCKAITWMDRRSEGIVADWHARGIDETVRQISGWRPVAGLPLPSICWFRQAQPALFAASRRFLSINDFVGLGLSGTFGTETSMAGEMLLAEIHTGQWSPVLCDLAGIEPGQLSPILPSGAVMGGVCPEAGRQTGLVAGTPVVIGGQDHACEALALGMTAGGSFLLACGSAWVLNGVTETGNVDELPVAMSLNFHVVPERWILSQFLGGLGAGLEWWLNQCWRGGGPQGQQAWQARYASFNTALQETLPGSAGLLFFPVSGGRQVAGSSPSGGWYGLRLDHTRAELGRAILESAAFEVRWALEEIGQAGWPVEQIWMVGGATRSSLWPRIVADVTGMPLALTQYSHGPALGAALLAGKALSLFDEFPFWISAQQIEPNPAHAPVYEGQFGAYQRMSRELFR